MSNLKEDDKAMREVLINAKVSEYLPAIVDEAIAVNAKTVWAQLGVSDELSAQKALDAGLNIVMDACIKVEYRRLRVS